MSEIIKNIRKIAQTGKRVFFCFLLCGVLTGCGIQDAAYTISIEESKIPTETADGGTREDSSRGDRKTETGEAMQQAAPEESSTLVICVYVCGAVKRPGVVELPEGSRAEDALQAAGGFSENAQEDYVNLAAKVTDGEKLYFPDREEAEELALAEQTVQKGLVNINTADEAELMTLPGIGESRAQDIISYREANGGFAEKEDLQKVSGIKGSVYAKLCDKIVTE